MRILKTERYRRMPWRNGHGETAQIAISPAAAMLEDFDWRVSMARAEVDGPFSQFPHTEGLTAEASLVLLVCADGSVQVDANGQTEALNSLDTALWDQVPATVSIATDGAALVYLIEIHRAS